MFQSDTKTKMKWAARLSMFLIGVRKLFGLSRFAKVTRGSIKWNLDLNEAIDLSTYLLGRFEVRTQDACSRLIERGDVVLDLGANVGAYSLPFSLAVGPEGSVIAIEASRESARRLLENLDLNPKLKPRVRMMHAWVSSSPEFSNIPKQVFSSWPLTGSHSRHPSHCGTVSETGSPPVLVLDALCEWIGSRRIGLIKIDLDGNEPEALEGAWVLLEKYRPVICMEVSPSLYAGTQERWAAFTSMIDRLRALGYRVEDTWSGEPIEISVKVLDACIHKGGSRNMLFIPQKQAASSGTPVREAAKSIQSQTG